jgi:hypothetical protein
MAHRWRHQSDRKDGSGRFVPVAGLEPARLYKVPGFGLQMSKPNYKHVILNGQNLFILGFFGACVSV